MIKSILVGLDAADNTPIVQKYALEIGCYFKARVDGVHVLDVRKLYSPFMEDVFYSMGMASVPNFQEVVRKRLEEIRDTLRDAFEAGLKESGLEGGFLSPEGVVAESITEEGHRHDLVVIGTKGEHFRMSEILLGSTFEEVIRRVNRPIIVVPAACEKFYVSRILLAYDGSDKSSNALQFVTQAVSGYERIELEVCVVDDGVVENADKVCEEAISYLDNHNVKFEASVLRGEVVESLLRHAEARSCDMIAMGSYSQSFMRHLILGSTTEELLSRVQIPTLVLR